MRCRAAGREVTLWGSERPELHSKLKSTCPAWNRAQPVLCRDILPASTLPRTTCARAPGLP